MRSALESAQVRTLAADGLSQREIARRLGINRRTVVRLLESDEASRYGRAPTGSQLDPFEPVLRRLLEEWRLIKAPRATECPAGDGSAARVRVRRLGRPCAAAAARATPARAAPGAADRLPAGAGPAARLDGDADAAEGGRSGARVYALVASLPYSGAQTAFS